MGAPVEVGPEELAALAAELTALAAELADDADGCRAAAAGLADALTGPEGRRAGVLLTAGASLTRALADDAAGLARTLTAALDSYRSLDAALAGRLTPADGPR
jgi:hypothetical protein